MFSFINIGNVARKKFDCSNLSSSAISGSLLRRETESKSQTSNNTAFKLSYMLIKEPEHHRICIQKFQNWCFFHQNSKCCQQEKILLQNFIIDISYKFWIFLSSRRSLPWRIGWQCPCRQASLWSTFQVSSKTHFHCHQGASLDPGNVCCLHMKPHHCTIQNRPPDPGLIWLNKICSGSCIDTFRLNVVLFWLSCCMQKMIWLAIHNF